MGQGSFSMNTPPQITPEQQAVAQERKRYLSTLTPDERVTDARLGLEAPRRAKVVHRVSQMPQTSISTYLKAVRGKSLAASVKAFCMECVCWKRREVALCTALACPLYAVRPFKTLLEEDDD